MFNMFVFDKPDPSLCDTCTNAGVVGGGSVGVGAKNYAQRYCYKFILLPGAKRKTSAAGGGISIGGLQECDYYDKCEDE